MQIGRKLQVLRLEEQDVLIPSVLILPRVANTFSDEFLLPEQGNIAVSNTDGKLHFLITPGVTEEAITSG